MCGGGGGTGAELGMKRFCGSRKEDFRGSGRGAVYRTEGGGEFPKRVKSGTEALWWRRTPVATRHDTTAPEEPFCVRGSIRLSLFLYYEL